jgi:hypothetical protein
VIGLGDMLGDCLNTDFIPVLVLSFFLVLPDAKAFYKGCAVLF